MDAAQQAELDASRAAEEAMERQRLAEKQKQWNANWGKPMPGVGMVQPGKLAPGERIVTPEE